MREALPIGVAVVVACLVVAWVLDRLGARRAYMFGGAANVLARVLGAAALVFVTTRVLRHHDPLNIVIAVPLCLLALWQAVTAATLLYFLIMDIGGFRSRRVRLESTDRVRGEEPVS